MPNLKINKKFAIRLFCQLKQLFLSLKYKPSRHLTKTTLKPVYTDSVVLTLYLRVFESQYDEETSNHPK